MLSPAAGSACAKTFARGNPPHAWWMGFLQMGLGFALRHTHTHTHGSQQIESPAGSYSSWCLPIFIVSSAESQTRNLSWFGWRRWEFGGIKIISLIMRALVSGGSCPVRFTAQEMGLLLLPSPEREGCGRWPPWALCLHLRPLNLVDLCLNLPNLTHGHRKAPGLSPSLDPSQFTTLRLTPLLLPDAPPPPSVMHLG